jgi:predicted Zn-dependent peptidase
VRRFLAKTVALAAVLLLSLASGAALSEVRVRPTGPPPDKKSPGSKKIESMSFPPLKLTIPRVGREVERLELEGGLVLYLMEDHTLPVFDLRATVRAGSLYTFREKPGLADFAGGQMREGGTEAYKPEELNRRLEFMAASIETGSGYETLSASLSCLSKDQDEGLELFAEVFLRPRFDEGKLELARQTHTEALRRRNDQPGAVAQREFEKLLFGEEHPYGHELREEEARDIKREDLLAFHRYYVRPNNTMMALVGDFNRKTIVGRLREVFKGWKPSEVSLPKPQAVVRRAVAGTYLGVKETPQSRIVLGHYGVDRHNPDRYAVTVMNYLLGGGGFSSRILKRVRVEEGLAYAVGTSFPTEGPVLGSFRAIGQTKTSTTERAVKIILEEIGRIRREPPGEEELARAKDAFINSYVFQFTSPVGNVVKLMHLEFFGYPSDYYETLLDKYRSVGPEDIRRVAETYLVPDRAAIVVVGPRELLSGGLGSLGPVKELDLSLRPLKTSSR